jgi:phosphate-selective porin OprO/OprP
MSQAKVSTIKNHLCKGNPPVSTNKSLFLVTLGVATVLGGVSASAQSADPSSTQAQIEDLKRKVEALERQQKQQTTAAPASSSAAPHVAESGSHKLSLESADGKYSIALTGRVHFDTGDYFSYQPDSSNTAAQPTQLLSNGTNARRARIGVTGKVAGGWQYSFIYDAGNSQDSSPAGIQTAQVSYVGKKGLIVDLPGYSEPPYPLDTAVSSNDIMFMERAVPVNLATSLGAGDFRSNAGVRVYGDRFWVGAYMLGPAQGDSHTNVRENLGSFQRVSAQVLANSNYSLHVGVNAFELLRAKDSAAGPTGFKSITLSDRPELRIDPTALYSSGTIGSLTNPVSSAQVYGAELAGGVASVYGQAEYFKYDVNRRGLSSNSFDGAYAQVSWTITGEQRKYSPTTGAYSAPSPKHPFGVDGGWGAWEIAVRYSYADLTDDFTPGLALSTQPAAINGGKLKDFTIGVNWYVNTYMRFMLNYVHSEVTDKVTTTAPTVANGFPALGTPIGYKLEGIALRTQFNW